MFRNSVTPVDLLTHTLQLRAGGVAEASTARGPVDAGLWTVARLRAEDGRALHADVWECHPTGNEVLVVLSGAVHLFLRDPPADEPTTLRPGDAVVVPVGAWHRLDVAEPADLMAITPRADTRHERISTHSEGGRA